MIRIVKITIRKQEQAAIELDVNGTIVPHITSVHLIYKYRLEEGKTLSQSEYNDFVKATEFDLLYNKALNYINYQMRSISEVKKQLRTKTKDEALIQRVVDELKKNHYLSDSSFVKEYVTEKLQFDTVGPIYIKDKLVQKGIHYDLIDAELLRYTEDIEYDKVREIVQKEIRYPQKRPYRKVVDALMRKCVTKGFRIGVVESAILSLQEDILAMVDETELLQDEFERLKKDYDLDTYEGRMKLIQKLLARGYSYDLVKKTVK